MEINVFLSYLLVVGLVETMMNERDEMRIEGYNVIRNDRYREGGV